MQTPYLRGKNSPETSLKVKKKMNLYFRTIGGSAGAKRRFTTKDLKNNNNKVPNCGPCRRAFLGPT